MEWHKVWVRCRGERERVEKEEAKYDHDGCKDTPPKFAVHQRLCGLLALIEVLHGRIERIERPDIERS